MLTPMIAIGHLSTTHLAAATVATMINNVTGFGLITGLTGYRLIGLSDVLSPTDTSLRALDHVLAPGFPSSSFPTFWCVCTSCILLLLSVVSNSL